MAFPQGFKVPKDQGGPGRGQSIGGFGGNPAKTQDEHKATVQSAGKAPIILLHGNSGSANSGPSVELLHVEALRVCSCKVRRTDMPAAHDKVNVYDARCKNF